VSARHPVTAAPAPARTANLFIDSILNPVPPRDLKSMRKRLIAYVDRDAIFVQPNRSIGVGRQHSCISSRNSNEMITDDHLLSINSYLFALSIRSDDKHSLP
jgi:hypothetical protein